MIASIFHGHRFFLTRTLSRELATEVRGLIEQHGGVVCSSPAGATEIVDYDKLNSRRPEWVSIDFVYDSVACGVLQDPAKYSGVVFSSLSSASQVKGRVRYSVEDDARLLHFAKLRGWESMKSVPASTWKLAESSRVTNHSWQSMHERFRKQLQGKTPKEQRVIMARAVEIIRARMQQSNDGGGMNEGSIVRASPSTATLENREPFTPTSTGSTTTPATSSLPPRRKFGQSGRQKRKRESLAINNAAELRQEEEIEEKGDEISVHDTGEARVVFFRSAWAEFAADPSRRARLQALFNSDVVQASPATETNSLKSFDSGSREYEAQTETITTQKCGNGETSRVGVQLVTEEDSKAVICQLQFETEQDLLVVVNALYYCCGSVDKARAFLKGSTPSSLGMWSPEDDILLINYIIDEDVDRSVVEAAVARGDFASMQVVRDTDAILDRIYFLR